MHGILNDVPASGLVQLAVYAFRLIRRTPMGRYIAFEFRNRIDLLLFTELHHKVAHQFRLLLLNQSVDPEGQHLSYDRLEGLANCCRDLMANVLEIKPMELHATIKIFSDEKCHSDVVDGPKSRALISEELKALKVYTIARSDDLDDYWAGRPFEIGQASSHTAGENSSFCSILGISDGKIDWGQYPRNCFVENQLTERADYVSSGDDWSKHYSATAVFPIRYKKEGVSQPIIVGFLTFDAKRKVFGSWLSYVNVYDPSEPKYYRQKLLTKVFYHTGGLLADLLVAGLANYRNVEERKQCKS